MSDLSFLAPARLWLLGLVVLVAVAYVVEQRRRRGYALRFTNLELLDSVAPRRPGWRRHLPAVVSLLSLVALVLAFARPAVAEEVPEREGVVVLAIDTSLSMQATDVDPSRIDAAVAAADRFLDQVPEGVRVGLVTFDGSARVDVAPVADVDVVRDALDHVELAEGTAIGEAVSASLAAAGDVVDASAADQEGDGSAASIVLLSDGETTVGRSNEDAAAEASDLGVPVHTIAFGTDAGTVTVQGQTVPVPVNRDALETLADETGGQPFSAFTAEELDAVYSELGRTVTHTTEERDVADLFAGAGLGLALLAGIVSLRFFARIP